MGKDSLEVHSAWCGAKFLRKRKLQSTNTTFTEFSIVGGGGEGAWGPHPTNFFENTTSKSMPPHGPLPT